MSLALKEAEKSGQDVPVGAIIIKNNEVIARAFNRKEANNDPTGHAEMLVIKEAAQKTNNWRLDNTILYVTLEPCPMCAAAILYSRVDEVVFGAYDPLYGAMGSTMDMRQYIKYNPHVMGGIMEDECSSLIKQFFAERRC